jgi:hypothetical protein
MQKEKILPDKETFDNLIAAFGQAGETKKMTTCFEMVIKLIFPFFKSFDI